jgi:hypothetical protein
LLARQKELMKYQTKTSLARLFQLIAQGIDSTGLQKIFKELDIQLQEKIREIANGKEASVKTAVASSSRYAASSSSVAGIAINDEQLFNNPSLLSEAVKKAVMDKFNHLGNARTKRVYGQILQLAEQPATDNLEAWGKANAFGHVLRFIDALEMVLDKG